MSAVDPTSAPSGRDSKGRFTKNNPGGPGNPHARQVAELRKRLLDKVTPEEMDAIIDAMLKRAREGDVSAAKLILQYTLGKPLDATNPDRLDADEADAFFSNALSAETQHLAQVQPLDLMLPLFRIAIATRGKSNMEQFAEQFVDAFGADGLEPEREAAKPRAAEDPAKPRAAAVTVTKPEEPVPPCGSMFRDMLLTAILTTPGKLDIPDQGKQGLTEICWNDGMPAAPIPPPLPPLDSDRPQTVNNGDSLAPSGGAKRPDRNGRHPKHATAQPGAG